MIVNRQRFAELVGVSLPTVSAWIGAGMPVKSRGARGREWSIETAPALAWVRDRDVEDALRRAHASAGSGAAELDEAQLRIAKARARQAELDLAEREGRTLDARAAEEVFGELVLHFRKGIQALHRAAVTALGLSPAQSRKLGAMHERCLRELSRFNFGRPSAREDGDEEEARESKRRRDARRRRRAAAGRDPAPSLGANP